MRTSVAQFKNVTTLLLRVSYEQSPNQIRPPESIVKKCTVYKIRATWTHEPIGYLFNITFQNHIMFCRAIHMYRQEYFYFICRSMLVHHMTLVSFPLFRKNLGNLREFLGKWFTATEPKNCPQAYVETNILECLYDRTGRQTDALLSILFGRVQLFCSRELPSINIVLHVSFFRYLWLRRGTHVCVLFLSFNIIILT